MYMSKLIFITLHCLKNNDASTFSILSLEFAVWIAIISLLFAIFTYWSDRMNQRSADIQTRKNLILELKVLYKVVCIDILQYKDVKESKYLEVFKLKFYNFSIIKYLVADNRLHKYFKNEDYVIGVNIHQILILDSPL